ncbi:c-type cytochrome [Solimonas terrae]|uniref:C-type cytochrome n=1 Tax=Solimonas terrae TaxID=1396819 RepID=A0A6M2BQG3_9GAMM|nr:c-type cytochrome [Solimonas terrae]NGY04862.1 c-type cytochrome [Solimonas terrae]
MKTVLAFVLVLGSVVIAQAAPPADAPVMSAAAPAPIGDVARGRKVFFQCRTCHYPEKAYGNHNGPNLYDVFGRKAGTREGYEHYSETMKHAGFVWTPQLLDFWLAHPDTFLPDSNMIVFPTTAQERADLIAYLQTFHD